MSGVVLVNMSVVMQTDKATLFRPAGAPRWDGGGAENVDPWVCWVPLLAWRWQTSQRDISLATWFAAKPEVQAWVRQVQQLAKGEAAIKEMDGVWAQVIDAAQAVAPEERQRFGESFREARNDEAIEFAKKLVSGGEKAAKLPAMPIVDASRPSLLLKGLQQRVQALEECVTYLLKQAGIVPGAGGPSPRGPNVNTDLPPVSINLE